MAAKKKPAKKAAPKKAVAKKAAKKPVAKKPVAKKVAKKPAAKKPAAPKKVAKPVAKKAAAPAKKVEVKKAAAPVAKKPEVKKATPAPKRETSSKKEHIVRKSEPVSPLVGMQQKHKKHESMLKKTVDLDSLPKPKLKASANVLKIGKPVITAKKESTGEEKSRYTDEDLQEFRKIINDKLAEARKDLDLLRSSLTHTSDNGTDDTSPTFKMMEDGSETLSREETAQLAGRQEKFIVALEHALIRIENKTYGICRVTGKLISKERLRLVPHTTLSIEAKNMQNA
jgi:DnaK suppressor protein